MKKTLLLTAALAASCATFAAMPLQKVSVLPDDSRFEIGPKAPAHTFTGATRAGEYIDFSYADELYSATSLNGTTPGVTRVYMMFQMKAADIKKFAGNQITGFTVYNPTGYNQTTNKLLPNTIESGRFFWSTDKVREDYSQNFKFGTESFGELYVDLDTPYSLTGNEEDLYFGYSIVVPKANDMFYAPYDGVVNDYSGSCLIGWSDTDDFPMSKDWMSGASQVGALCMSIRLEGDNLPTNEASIPYVDAPLYLPLTGDGNGIAFYVQNVGANSLTSVEVTASIAGMPDVSETINFSKPISYNMMAEATLLGLKGSQAGYQTINLRITKVNDVDFDGKATEVTVPVYDNGFPRKIVAEDATGTWCPWCPGGIEALEYLKKTYPDRAIAIGVHSGDVMEISSYNGFIKDYVSGFPCVLYNRTIQQTPTDSYQNVCSFIDAVAGYLDAPSYGQVVLEGKTKEDNTAAEIKATSKFAFDTNDTHYLSFVIIENGVGPYNQANNFSTAKIPMNGWETKGRSVKTIYDDVARYYNQYPGIKNSIPANVKAQEEYVYEIELPLVEANGNKLIKGLDYTVIALLTSAVDGRIVNACQLPMQKDTSGVKAVSADDNITIEGGNGQVIVNGADAYSVYTLAGMKVANNNLPAGLYIVVADGKSAKVIVK